MHGCQMWLRAHAGRPESCITHCLAHKLETLPQVIWPHAAGKSDVGRMWLFGVAYPGCPRIEKRDWGAAHRSCCKPGEQARFTSWSEETIARRFPRGHGVPFAYDLPDRLSKQRTRGNLPCTVTETYFQKYTVYHQIAHLKIFWLNCFFMIAKWEPV